MSFSNTPASARCMPRSDELQPFELLPSRVETVKTVYLAEGVLHRAKASVLMIEGAASSIGPEWVGLGGAPGGRALLLLLIAATIFASCRADMNNQPKAKPLSESDFFSNQANARPIPPYTVERGDARENAAFYTGLTNGAYVTQLPIQLTPALLTRGRERFDAVCAECHDRTGSGNGMVVQRGFPQPPSFHVDRLRDAPIGHFFDVVTKGYGVMYSYATRVEPEDRWAIAAYIRALQLSHHAEASELTSAEQRKLGNEQ